MVVISGVRIFVSVNLYIGLISLIKTVIYSSLAEAICLLSSSLVPTLKNSMIQRMNVENLTIFLQNPSHIASSSRSAEPTELKHSHRRNH